MAEENAPRITSTMPVERLAYKPADAAALLGIGRNRVFELLKSGDLASVRYGRTRLIPRKAIERFLETEAA